MVKQVRESKREKHKIYVIRQFIYVHKKESSCYYSIFVGLQNILILYRTRKLKTTPKISRNQHVATQPYSYRSTTLSICFHAAEEDMSCRGTKFTGSFLWYLPCRDTNYFMSWHKPFFQILLVPYREKLSSHPYLLIITNKPKVYFFIG